MEHGRSHDSSPSVTSCARSATYQFDLDRRGFLKSLGGGILVVHLLNTGACRRSSPAAAAAGGGGGQPVPRDIAAWLHIGEDGKITVYTGKAEVGQNIRTSLTQVVAEELRVAPSSIHLVMADTQLTPFDMGTFGSRTTPDMSRRLRRTAAAAREMLIDLAAETWKADRASLSARRRHHRPLQDRKKLEYRQADQGPEAHQSRRRRCSRRRPPDELDDRRHSQPKVDGRVVRHRQASVCVRHQAAGNVVRQGTAAPFVRCDPCIGRARRGAGDAGRGRRPRRRFRRRCRPQQSAGVTRTGRDQGPVEARPRDLRQGSLREPEVARAAGAAASRRRRPNQPSRREGRRTLPASISSRLTRSPTSPMPRSSHVPPSPGGKTASSRCGPEPSAPSGCAASSRGLSAFPPDAVRVIVPDTGAGYGGKHTGEAAVEAARLARQAGKPVKLVWTREEEFTWAYFRPAGVIEVKSSARRDGMLTAWEFHNYNSGGSAIRSLYDVPNQQSSSTQFHRPYGRALIAHSPPRPITSRASRTWTSSPTPPASIRSNSG